MHELAIVQSVVDTIGERLGEARVSRVTLEIGRLSGVVSDSVRFCFDLVAQGTTLDGATLDIVEEPGRATCRTCGSDVELTDLIALCPCGSADLNISSGGQLRIREVEVV